MWSALRSEMKLYCNSRGHFTVFPMNAVYLHVYALVVLLCPDLCKLFQGKKICFLCSAISFDWWGMTVWACANGGLKISSLRANGFQEGFFFLFLFLFWDKRKIVNLLILSAPAILKKRCYCQVLLDDCFCDGSFVFGWRFYSHLLS